MNLRQKIITLFEYRALPELIHFANGTDNPQFLEKLIHLQTEIYFLDDVLESNWLPAEKELAEKWKQIHEALLDLGVAEDQLDNYCRHIYKYQKHELEIREQKLPTRLSMEYFYFYKSCDVKLLRRLIYDKYPKLNSLISLADWRVFDLITEVNDDVEDLFEDQETINGNRFLLSILQLGKDKTREIFGGFLEELSHRNAADQFSPTLAELGIDVKEWNKKNIQETLALMEHNLEEIDFETLRNSQIFPQLQVI